MIASAPADERVPFTHKVRCATGGAAPPSSVFRAMEAIGFEVTHLYGATELMAPARSASSNPNGIAFPRSSDTPTWRAKASRIRWSRT